MTTPFRPLLVLLMGLLCAPALAQRNIRVYEGPGLDVEGLIDAEIYQQLYFGEFDALRAINGFERRNTSATCSWMPPRGMHPHAGTSSPPTASRSP